MTITLAQARSRVQIYVDDIEGARWTTAQIDAELSTAVEQAVSESISAGLDIFSITQIYALDANGFADLSADNPFKVITVAQFAGQNRLLVQPSRRRSMLTPATGLNATQIEVTYAPHPVFPTVPSDPIVYGTATSAKSGILDALICAIAASSLKITEGEVNNGLEKRKAELMTSLLNIADNPSCYIMPFTGYPNQYRSLFRWIMNGQRIQLFIDQGSGF